MGPVGQPLGTKTCDILIIFHPWYCLFFNPFRWTFYLVIKVEGRCRMWVQYVMLSYNAVAMKNTKKNTWLRIRTQDLSLYKPNEKLHCHRTNMMFAYISPQQRCTIVSFTIPSFKHLCCWWVPKVSLSVLETFDILIIFYQCLSFYGQRTLQDVGPICHTHILLHDLRFSHIRPLNLRITDRRRWESRTN